MLSGNGSSYLCLQCPCGQMRYCRNRPSNCNCNGTTESGLDEGKEIDKNKLPFLKFVSNVNSGKADVTFGPVKCAPKPYGESLLKTVFKCRVFHDPLVSLNFEGFDPQIFLSDPHNLLFTFFNLHVYEGGHCDPLNNDPLNRKLRENPA